MSNAEVAECLRVVWIGYILAEIILLAALIYNREFKTTPCFVSFVAFSLLRAMVLFPLWREKTWTAYGYTNLITAPADMILMSCSGIEAFAKLAGGHPTLRTYLAFLVPVLIAGAVIPAQYVQSRAVPTWQEIIMNKVFMERAVLASLPVGILWGWACVQLRPPDARTMILMVFLLFDLVAYFSLAIAPGWVKARPFDAALFMLAGQACCLMAWTILFTARTRAEEIS